jgi:hypothetical protein
LGERRIKGGTFEDTNPNREKGIAVKALLEELESSMLQAMGG